MNNFLEIYIRASKTTTKDQFLPVDPVQLTDLLDDVRLLSTQAFFQSFASNLEARLKKHIARHSLGEAVNEQVRLRRGEVISNNIDNQLRSGDEV
jgi:hypothetical protein